MKRYAIATAIAVLSATNAAQAASTDSATVNLTATVDSTCYIADANFTPGTLDFGSQIDGTTAILATSGISATVDAYCNDASTTLDLTSANGGLKDSSVATIAGSGSFAGTSDGVTGRILPYSTSGSTWAGVSFTTEFDSDGTAATELTTTAINGTISTTVTLDAQSSPVLAGTYTDVMTVTITTGP